MEILQLSLTLGFGFFLGGTVEYFLMKSRRDYSGTIVVNRDELTERVVYTLELDDYPETLQFKKVVIFKVDNPDESSDRK